jgi:hypothetical protein
MANFSFDVALGREVELYNRVNDSDPTNAVLVLVALAHAGLQADAVLRTHATLSALLAASNNEVTNPGYYSRIILDDTDLAAYTVDTTNHLINLPLADQTFIGIEAGDSWSKLLICYDPDSTGGTDANIVPMCAHDIRISGAPAVPNGNNILITFPYGILTAS